MTTVGSEEEAGIAGVVGNDEVRVGCPTRGRLASLQRAGAERGEDASILRERHPASSRVEILDHRGVRDCW